MRAPVLRRVIALVLLGLFVTTAATNAECALPTPGTAAPHEVTPAPARAHAPEHEVTRAPARAPEHEHDHEHSAPPAQSEYDGTSHERTHDNDGCGLLMACGLAALATYTPDVALLADPLEAGSVLLRNAHDSPALAFEPPPPRRLLKPS